MDLQSLTSELHLRGLDQSEVDSALRCLVHVYSVQDTVSLEAGGILAQDILENYDLNVVQAATQLFLDKAMSQGREVFRVKWGCDSAAGAMQDQLWDHAAYRWEEFVAQLNDRYLGFILLGKEEDGRVVNNWKLGKELRWFSVEVPSHGWSIIGMIDDISEVAWKLDLAFGYRSYGPEGIQAPRVLLHKKAYEILRSRGVPPGGDLLKQVRLWRFFSEYDINSTDFVALTRECDLKLDDVVEQVNKFFSINLTSQYREGQYPPYFINDKKGKEYEKAVRELLQPMNVWLVRKDMAQATPRPLPGSAERNPKRMSDLLASDR
ncbi:MAG TPA: hypothetical protein VLU91_04130 [Nitrososphaerales archaeon]|nr:hypothetical protein [Nitrososphaerales archaeon]